MKIRTPYYYDDFKCIASKCSDTCCAGWEIIIDDETLKRYKNVNGSFGEKLNSKITSYEDNEKGFILEKDNCPFLNKNLLCDIYLNLGEDYLCHTCKTFPRIIEEYGSLREICLSLSCPEAARLILKDSKKVTFNISENDELVTTYNTLSPELYLQIIKCRKTAFDIIQDSSIEFNKRLALLLSFASEIQGKIDECQLSKITSIRKNYSNADFLNTLSLSFNSYKDNKEMKYDTMHKYMEVFNCLEEINEIWPEIIKHEIETFYKNNDIGFYYSSTKEFLNYYHNESYQYDNLAVYFLNRYFMKSLFDADLFSKIKLMIMSYLIIKELNIVRWIDNNKTFNLEDQIYISHMYSKEIEHSDNNLEKLHELFNTDKIYNLETMITLIMN